MKKGVLALVVCLLCIPVLAVSQVFAVEVYGEGAYDDSVANVQVNIYAKIDPSDALRSFGVRLNYNPTELEFDATKSKTNDRTWFLGEGTGGANYSYRGPESIDVDESTKAVVMIGGKLDMNDTAAKVEGTRVLLGTIWFNRLSGSGPLSSSLTVELGKTTPFANFVVGPNEADVLDSAIVFSGTAVHERGDANADGNITGADRGAVMFYLSRGGIHYVWMDCNADGNITGADRGCIMFKLTN